MAGKVTKDMTFFFAFLMSISTTMLKSTTIFLFGLFFTLNCKSQDFPLLNMHELDEKVRIRNCELHYVKNDTAYLSYLGPTNTLICRTICLSTGKTVKEIMCNRSDTLGDFFPSDEGLITLSIQVLDNKIVIRKRIMNFNLKIVDTKELLIIPLSSPLEWDDFSIRDQGTFYELMYMNDCTQSSGKSSKHSLSLYTFSKNLKLIDDFYFDGGSSTYVASIHPTKKYSNNITHQLLVNYKDPEAYQLLIWPDHTGHFKIAKTKRFNSYLNFIPAKDSAGKTSGYCFRLAQETKKKWTLSMDRFEFDHKSERLSLTARNILVKHCNFPNLHSLCTKSIAGNSSCKLITYLIGGNASAITMGHATYMEVEKDNVIFKYNLPFNYARTHILRSDIDLFMAEGKDRTFIVYNDTPENPGPITEAEYEKIPQQNSNKLRYGPVFYQMPDGGGANKYALKFPGTGEVVRGVIVPNGGCKIGDNYYFVAFGESPKKKVWILRLAEDEAKQN